MANFYFAVFVIGFGLTVISFVTGFAGHSFGHGGDFGDGADAGHGAGAGGTVSGDGSQTHVHPSAGIPFANFGTVTAFMTWFGGIGFLLTSYSNLLAVITVGVAILGGATGAGIIFLFMARVLAPDQIPMDPSDYYMPGTLGRVTVSIPRDGTGGMVYTQGGSRKTAAARGTEGQAIDRGTEVVVMHYERGIVYVSSWEQAAAEGSGRRKS